VSPTTSNAANAPLPSAPASPAQGRDRQSADAAAQFEGLLFATALEPLSRSIGMLGDVLTDAVATEVARGSHDDLYGRLQTLVEGEPSP
jgi:hypothetical protein